MIEGRARTKNLQNLEEGRKHGLDELMKRLIVRDNAEPRSAKETQHNGTAWQVNNPAIEFEKFFTMSFNCVNLAWKDGSAEDWILGSGLGRE